MPNFKITTTKQFQGDKDEILKLAYGGKPDTSLAEGGMAEGPPHEEGGIEIQDKSSGEAVAEIEGGERVFSKEDTAMLEQAAEQIIMAQQSGDKAGAEDMAMRLGFAVVQMIAAQEQNQAAQEQQMAERSPQPGQGEEEAMNSFAQEPDPFA